MKLPLLLTIFLFSPFLPAQDFLTLRCQTMEPNLAHQSIIAIENHGYEGSTTLTVRPLMGSQQPVSVFHVRKVETHNQNTVFECEPDIRLEVQNLKSSSDPNYLGSRSTGDFFYKGARRPVWCQVPVWP